MLETQWHAWVGRLGARLEQATAANPTAQAHAYFLRDMAEHTKYLMSEAEESLASELSLSRATAWQQLQWTVTSQMGLDFELGCISERDKGLCLFLMDSTKKASCTVSATGFFAIYE